MKVSSVHEEVAQHALRFAHSPHQNMYTIEANLDDNGYQMNTPCVHVRGGQSAKLAAFQSLRNLRGGHDPGPDGTVYIAGMNYPDTTTFSVMKFSPPNYAPQTLVADPQAPSYLVGMSLDASGNLFVGWLTSNVDYPFGPCITGCIEELPTGGNAWQTMLPDLAANDMSAGPFATTNGSLVFWTGMSGRFNYFETVPAGRSYPSQVIQESPNFVLNGGNPALAFEAGGDELWATGTGFGGPLGTNVTGVAYPSGSILTQFPVNAPADLILHYWNRG